ncbi:hypothetical protein [Desulfoluna spongiiphila]|uniref:Uncharacterized protein n=1 Tax=Desulfoluna spongiiphila TaxID=419481 RepID=A0A1G5EKT1_9BACT|nr:hypothetical protein [Desulfoluna spongiiphila]SCY27544.1 hypothetical protein SAMN05216233_10676 [Desulfoluna spongiiphila]
MGIKSDMRFCFFLLVFLVAGSSCVERPWHHSAGEYVVVQPSAGQSLDTVASDFGGGPAGLPAIEALNPPALTPANTPLLVPATPAYELGIRAGGYQVVPVLTYRWVGGADFEALEARLRADLLQLQSLGHSLLSPDEFLGFIRMERSVSSGAVLLAFEVYHAEGFRAFWERSSDLGLTGLLFIEPSTVGTEGALTWEEVARLSGDAMEPALLPPGGQGLTAPASKETLVGYTLRVKETITTSHGLLAGNVPGPVRFAAYPDGVGNSVMASVMVSLGMKGIFISGEEGNPFFCDNLSVVRMDAGGRGAEVPLDRYLDTFREAALSW